MILRNQQANSVVQRAAFTLMEMMVVVAILVVLVGVAVPTYLTYVEQSNMKRAWTDAKTIQQVAEKYFYDNGAWPQQITDLLAQDANGNQLIKETALIDPWGKQYVLTSPGQHEPTKVDVSTTRLNITIGSWQRGNMIGKE